MEHNGGGERERLPEFRVGDKTVEEICKNSFRESKTKMSVDSVRLTAELLKVYCAEAFARSAAQAKRQGMDVVQMEHLEKIMPQFLLDFN